MRTATKTRWAGRARNRPILRAALAVVFVAAIGIAGVSGPATATDISIPFDELVFGQPGSTVDIATVEVGEEMVGRTCHLAVLAENQSSVHIGNDLIVSTGTSQAVIFGVEDTPNGGTSETYEMVVGPTILVQLRIGQDGMSSLGFDLSFDCVAPPVEATTSTIDQQQVVSTTTTTTTTAVDCSTAGQTTSSASGQTTSSSAAGQAGSAGDGCAPACSTTDGTDGSGSASGGTDTTVAGQATTGTTVCASSQVTSSTTTTTAVTPTVAGSSTNQLPQTPAAEAVTGSPAYTG